MLLELFGGPLDGTICDGPEHMPPYVVAANHSEEPVYRRMYCQCCAAGKVTMPYRFVGYDSQEVPEEQIDRLQLELNYAKELPNA